MYSDEERIFQPESLAHDPAWIPAWLEEIDRLVIRAPGRTAISFGLVVMDLKCDRKVKSWIFEEDDNYRREAKRIVAASVEQREQFDTEREAVQRLLTRADPSVKWNVSILAEYIHSELN